MNKSTLASFILALSTFIFIGLVLPQYSDLQSQRKDLKSQEEKLARTKEGIVSLEALKNIYNEHLTDADNLNIFLPHDANRDHIITSLEKASEESGMRLKDVSINADSQSQTSNYDGISIQISSEGSFDGAMTFIDKLEKSLRLYDIRSVSFKPLSDSNSVNMSFDILTYKL